jgi:hypothetical protein
MDIGNNINWERLIESMAFYTSLGYKYRDLNWTVSKDVSEITKPNDRKDYFVEDRAVVASGEQSFLELLKHGRIKQGKYHGITPCFRDETTIDYLHQRYFMKVELIDTKNTNHESLEDMIIIAKEYYSQYLGVELLECDGVFDLIDSKHKIELGSYGLRQYDDIKWVFGTGVAEPRLSKILKLN